MEAINLVVVACHGEIWCQVGGRFFIPAPEYMVFKYVTLVTLHIVIIPPNQWLSVGSIHSQKEGATNG